MLKLRDYQIELSSKAADLLQQYRFVILSMEVRTGKTITALETVKKDGAKNVLFLTKKKAISSIEADYSYYKDDFYCKVINYESLHKVEWEFDMIVLDESHWLSSFPKPWKRYKDIKKRFWHLDMILLTGTLSTESYSQYFHQIHVSYHTVWNKYKNFYRWADRFVKTKQIKTSYWWATCYKTANYDRIMSEVGHYIITFTQKQANFKTIINEKVLYVKMKPQTYSLINKLKKDKVIEGKDDVILADTKVKELQKIQQLCSWTCKTEWWKWIIFDKSKAEFIKKHFKWKKIAIFYLFKAEEKLLKETFGDTITDNLQEFQTTDKHFFTQIVKGREWISLKEADCLIFYNIAFSALSYFQARDRLTTKERLENNIYWVFAEDWIEDYVYKMVTKKKDFTTKVFEKLWQNGKI